jgi:hypothetical protein
MAATRAAPADSKSGSPEDRPVSSPALQEQPVASPAAGEPPMGRAGEPGFGGEPAPEDRVETVAAPAPGGLTAEGLSPLMVLQGLAAGLLALFSLATGAIWWRHRTRYQ